MVGSPVIRVLVGDHHADEAAEIDERRGEGARIDQEGVLVHIDAEGCMFELRDAHETSQPLRTLGGKHIPARHARESETGGSILRSENRRGILERLSRDGNVRPDGPIV
ncbi:hypothetical protein GCM10010458_06920 [Microbacterium luteolum]